MKKVSAKMFKNWDTTVTVPKLTELYGQPKHENSKIIRLYDTNVLQLLTEGLGQLYSVKGAGKEGVKGSKYEFKVKGVPFYATEIAISAPQDYNLGRNFEPFNICLAEPSFNENDIMILQNKQTLKVLNNHIYLGDGKYQYRVIISGNDPNEAVDFTYLTVGRTVSMLGNAQPELSRIGYHQERDNFETRVNYMQKIRRGIEISGEAQMAEFYITDTVNGKQQVVASMTKKQDDINKELFMLRELTAIFGRSNVDPQTDRILGQSNFSEDAMTCDGVYTQIRRDGIYETYTRFSEARLQQMLHEVVRRNPTKSLSNTNVVFMTGTMGMAEVQTLFRNTLNGFTATDKIFFDRNGDKVTMGATMMKYIYMGATITFVHNPVFDNSQLLADEIDPTTGFPRMSSTFLMLDMTSYDGVPNVKIATKQGCNLITNIVEGLGGTTGNTSGKSASPVHGYRYDALTYVMPIVHLPETCMILEKSRVV